jgi:hypothetical protein
VIGATREFDSGDFFALAMSFPIVPSNHPQLDMRMVFNATSRRTS